MKSSTILTIFGLAGVGAAQGPIVTPISSPSSLARPATVTVLPPVVSSSSATAPFGTGNRTTTTTTTTITTVVSQFVTICAEPTTFYVEDVCYTATSSYQPVTVTNCPCTVVTTATTPYVAPTGTTCIVTGYLATSTAAAVVPPPAVSTAGAVGATQYTAATSTQYVTAAGSKPTLTLGLMASLVSLPLLAALML